MKKLIAAYGAVLASAGPLMAGLEPPQCGTGAVPCPVPEMSATGAVVALAAIAAGGAIAWERRRNRPPKD